MARVSGDPLLYLITLALSFRLKNRRFLPVQCVRFSMPVQWKFRFLDRTDSRRCRSLIRSCGERCLLSRLFSTRYFVKGERSECISPLTTLGKTGCTGWEVSRSEAFHLTDAVGFDFASEANQDLAGGAGANIVSRGKGTKCEQKRAFYTLFPYPASVKKWQGKYHDEEHQFQSE